MKRARTVLTTGIWVALSGVVGQSSQLHAVEVERHDLYTRYVYSVNDFLTRYGAATANGWGSGMEPNIRPDCMVSTVPISVVGPGTLSVKVVHETDSWPYVASAAELVSAPTAVVMLYAKDQLPGEEAAVRLTIGQAIAIGSGNQWRVTEFSRDPSGIVFHAQTRGAVMFQELPTLDFHGNAREVTVKICSVMERTNTVIRKIYIDVTK